MCKEDQERTKSIKKQRNICKNLFFFFQMVSWMQGGESIEFAGKAVVHLAADGNIMQRTGKIVNVSTSGLSLRNTP